MAWIPLKDLKDMNPIEVAAYAVTDKIDDQPGSSVFCNNESVFKNSTRPESTLKKKHNIIAYHRTREAIAAGIICVAWEDGQFNLANVLTNLMPGPKLRNLVSCILY